MRYRVWWIPQVPGKPFQVECKDHSEAEKLVEVLADYDLFQYEHNIKPDYCNVGGIQAFEEDDDWCDCDCPKCSGEEEDDEVEAV